MNGDHSAFPIHDAGAGTEWGLSQRQLLAAMAWATAFKVYEAGYTGEPRGEETMPILVAKVAVEMADALLAELHKTPAQSACAKENT